MNISRRPLNKDVGKTNKESSICRYLRNTGWLENEGFLQHGDCCLRVLVFGCRSSAEFTAHRWHQCRSVLLKLLSLNKKRSRPKGGGEKRYSCRKSFLTGSVNQSFFNVSNTITRRGSFSFFHMMCNLKTKKADFPSLSSTVLCHCVNALFIFDTAGVLTDGLRVWMSGSTRQTVL